MKMLASIAVAFALLATPAYAQERPISPNNPAPAATAAPEAKSDWCGPQVEMLVDYAVRVRPDLENERPMIEQNRFEECIADPQAFYALLVTQGLVE